MQNAVNLRYVGAMTNTEHKNQLVSRYQSVIMRIRHAEKAAQRPRGSVSLVAVSKTYPATDIRLVAEQGQTAFGENYLQDALPKINELKDMNLQWHFIGHIQSNKCRDIAAHFDWVHSVDRFKIGKRLSDQRSTEQADLNIFLQVNLHDEVSKSGVSPDQAADTARQISALPNIRLRGLMAIPEPSDDFTRQRNVFAEVRTLQERLVDEGLQLDCLSMGMTGDLEAAVAEGATHVRIGTAIFGPRQKKPQ